MLCLAVWLKVLAIMEGERVVSKHLFNFQPAGVVDADILAKEQEMLEMMGAEGMNDIQNKMKEMSDEDFAVMLNGMMEGMKETVLKNTIFSEVALVWLTLPLSKP